jgi:cell division septal protein FtsQ
VVRKYNIPLEEPGVEVQFPTLSLSISPRGVSTVLVILAGGALLFLLTAPMFRVEGPQVRGTSYISRDAVLNAAGLEGSNLFLVSPSEIGMEITRTIPGIHQANVTVDTSGEVWMDVVERAPILLWAQSGKEYWVDAEGVIYPATQKLEGLVRVEVQDQGPQILLDEQSDLDPQVVINTLEMAVALPSGSRIVYDKAHGLGMLDTGGWTVYFGNSGQIEQKMETYHRLLQKLNAAGIRPSIVDVSDLWQPFYRR